MTEATEPRPVESVLIVEDHRDAANILRMVVNEVFPEAAIEVAYTFAEGLSCLENSRYAIALLDLGLPDGDGLDLIRYVARNHGETLTIVTTIFDDEEHLFDALKFGASGYLLKGYSAEELADYLGEAIAGRPALSPRIAKSMLGYFRQSEGKGAGHTEAYGKEHGDEYGEKQSEQLLLEQLTQRELDVLTLIAKGCGVKEVSTLLSISSNTVSHHIKNLYSKLNIHNRAEATAAAVQLNIFKP
jgi:DNA-binding NarL/FixJ family response regulator